LTCDFRGRLVILSAPGPQAAENGVHDGPGAVFVARPEVSPFAEPFDGRTEALLHITHARTYTVVGEKPSAARALLAAEDAPVMSFCARPRHTYDGTRRGEG
jgi:hypothetical protein